MVKLVNAENICHIFPYIFYGVHMIYRVRYSSIPSVQTYILLATIGRTYATFLDDCFKAVRLVHIETEIRAEGRVCNNSAVDSDLLLYFYS